MMLRPLITILLVSSQFQILSTAEAGPLAQTARGVDNSSSTRSSSSSSSSSGSNDSDNSSSGFFADGETSPDYSLMEGSQCTDDCFTLDLPPPTLDVGFSGQKVLDSDASLHVDSQLLFGRIGISGQFDHYYEDIEAMHQTPDTVKINLFELAVLGRVVETDTISVDIRAGFGATSSTHFDTLVGMVVGATVQGRLSDQLSLRGSVRQYALQNDIGVTEGVIGAQLSYLWAGYRAMRFDVGPLIEGPEIGLRMQFR